MYYCTEEDRGRGTVKTCWSKIRERVLAVNPRLVAVSEACGIDDSDSFYLLYVPFGMPMTGQDCLHLPKENSFDYWKLSHTSDPSSPIYQDLKYGIGSCPFGMVLRHTFELCAELKTRVASKLIYQEGDFISFINGLNLTDESSTNYLANFLYEAIAGARSLYVSPSIGNQARFDRLSTDPSISGLYAPKSVLEHGELLRALSRVLPGAREWRAEVLFFPESLMNKIRDLDHYAPVFKYLTQKYQQRFREDIIRDAQDALFSTIMEELELTPEALVMETIQHVFNVAMGKLPGFAPILDDKMGPFSALADGFVYGYELDDIPTVMGPAYMDPDRPFEPLYISLNVPSAIAWSKSKLKKFVMIDHMIEIIRCFRLVLNYLKSPDCPHKNTAYAQVAREFEFTYIHDYDDWQRLVKDTSILEKEDPRFLQSLCKTQPPHTPFYHRGEFFRGCIRIQRKPDCDEAEAAELIQSE